MNHLADNLRRLRLNKKWTQEQLAEQLGVSAQAVSRWETGATCPDVMLLPQMAEMFGVLVDDLFRPSPKGYENNARRLLAVYEHSHKPEDFLAAAEEFEKLIKAGTAAAEDWRCYGLLHEYMAYHCIRKATGSYHQGMDRSRCTDPELYHRTLRQSILLRCRIGEGETCIREREAALQEHRDSVQAWIDLAHACFFGGQPEKTLETCEKALEEFPEEGLLHVYAGDAGRTLKDYDRAFIHWQKAAELDMKYMDALFSMAFCREELGQYEKAARNWEDIARRLEEQRMAEEAKMPRNMAEKCRAKLFG
ncbi:MAG: helix-turn-helix domain-containing protein [Clostridia bacterium]|nr:helix-turn-helix domain-containing protein [Clostridia bacterium]